MNKLVINNFVKSALLFTAIYTSLAFSSVLLAATFTVSNNLECVAAANTSGGCPTGFAPAPGSLRQAILDSNASPGPNVISFMIPGCGPNSNTSNVCSINVIPTGLPSVVGTVSIDGSIPENRTNIPGSVKTPNVYATLRPGIEINGTGTKSGIICLTLDHNIASVVKGLVINRCANTAIFVIGGSNIVIQGNYLGTDINGTSLLGNGRGIGINGPTNAFSTNITIGGLDTNQRNIVSGSNIGTGIVANNSSYTKILGNFVGTDVYGLAAFGNKFENIDIGNAGGNNITSANNRAEYNLVLDDKNRSGMRLLGRKFLDSNCHVTSDDPVINTVLVNNKIGVNLAGNPVPNFQGGVIMNDDAQNSFVGFDMVNGQIVPMPNTIAGNRDAGIMVISSAPRSCTSVPTNPAGHAFLYNIIYGNSTLGIDLTPVVNGSSNFNGDGVTFNHSPGTPGPNNFQNYPVLDPINSFANPALAQIYGSLDSAPNSQYFIQIFSNESAVCLQLKVNPSVIPAGYQPSPGCTTDTAAGFTTSFLAGQGHVLIGQAIVTTDANGHVDFHIPSMLNSLIGTIVTSTATALQLMPDGSLVPKDTSEFSQAIDINQKGSANAYLHANGAAGGDNGSGAVQGDVDVQ